MRYIALIILFLVSTTGSYSQRAASDYGILEQYLRPGNHELPTPVTLGIYVVDILDIDDVERTITLDYFISMNWNDPRLADDQIEIPSEKHELEMTDIWHPHITPVNIKAQTPQDPIMTIDSQGTVLYRQRMMASFTTPLDLKHFPFDEQAFELKFLSTIYGPADIDLQLAEDRSGHLDSFSVPGWSFLEFGYEKNARNLQNVDRTLSGVNIKIHMSRDSGFYVWKVFVPLGFIVFMAWTVFWIDPAEFQGQVAISSASVITLIAFQLSLSELLPKISYLTKVDLYALATSFLVFLALGESILTARLAKAKKRHIGLKIDRWMRSIYPAVFLLLILIVVL